MKTLKRTKAKANPTPRGAQLRLRVVAPWCIACLASFVFAGCHAKSNAQQVDWVDVDQAVGPGVVRVTNFSDATITRLWFSPTDVDGLWPGATPEGFAPLATGESYEHEIPMGWWDVWFENENGEDALLYRTWFGGHDTTAFDVKDSWWNLGDWIQEAP